MAGSGRQQCARDASGWTVLNLTDGDSGGCPIAGSRAYRTTSVEALARHADSAGFGTALSGNAFGSSEIHLR
jgi:hypothetical protein